MACQCPRRERFVAPGKLAYFIIFVLLGTAIIWAFVEYAVALAVRQDPQRGFVVVFIGLSFLLSGSLNRCFVVKEKNERYTV